MSTSSRLLSRRALLAGTAGLVGLAGSSVLAACGGGAATTSATTASVSATLSASSTTPAPTTSSAAATTSAATTTSSATTAAASTATSSTTAASSATASSSSAAAAASAPAAGVQTVNIWFDYGGGGMYAFEDITAAFNQKYPNIKATATQVSDYRNKRLAAIASNSLKGGWAWLMYGYELPEFAQKGLLRPVDEYIARDKVDMKQFWPIVVVETTWNGKNYGMTNHPAVIVLWLNQDLARTKGIDGSATPANWDDIMSDTQKLTEKSGQTFTQIGLDPTSTPYSSWGAFWMNANGVSLLSDDGKKATFNTDAARSSLNYVVQMIDQVYGSAKAISDWRKAMHFKYAAFAEGKAGLETNGNWIAWDVGQVPDHVPFTIGGIPGGPNNTGKQYLPEFGVFNSIPMAATEPDPSWTYINYFASKEGQLIMQKRSEDVPGNIAAAQDPAEVKQHYGRAQVLTLFGKANAIVYVRSPAYTNVDKALGTMSSDVVNKKTDVSAALQTAQQAVQVALDNYWKGQS